MRVRQALNRRARAFDLAQLCTYMEEVLQKEPAPNAMPVTALTFCDLDWNSICPAHCAGQH